MTKRIYKTLIALCFGLSGACVFAPPLFAQSIDATGAPVQYLVTPESPAPHSPVIIEARGVGSFLGDSLITWSVDGATVLSGTGASKYSFTTGGAGKKMSVRVDIDSIPYGTITRTFTFNPSTVDLLWEADTSVPPFYAGKALMSAGARVRVAAFPTVFEDGRALPPSGLSYQWRLNDQSQPSSSGLGRSTFSFAGNQLHPDETVAVDVLYAGAKVGHAEVVLTPAAPLLLVYAKDPLRGVLWDTALTGSAALPGQEAIAHAEPYFFSKDSIAGGLVQYLWALNGQEVSGPDSPYGELTLRQTGGGSGSANLSVALQNTDDTKLLQRAQTALTVLFGQSVNAFTSLFGI